MTAKHVLLLLYQTKFIFISYIPSFKFNNIYIYKIIIIKQYLS